MSYLSRTHRRLRDCSVAHSASKRRKRRGRNREDDPSTHGSGPLTRGDAPSDGAFGASSSLKASGYLSARLTAQQFREGVRWLSSYADVSRWARKLDVPARVDAARGILHVRNLLPAHVAWTALRILEELPREAWVRTAAASDLAANNIAHCFRSARGGSQHLDTLLRALAALNPTQIPSLSAGCYTEGHHIAPHDDRQCTDVAMDDGTVQRCYRDLTAVFYFTPAWERAWGGLFRDLEHGARAADSNPRRRKRGGLRAVSDTVPPRTGPTAREVVPEFNSAVFFRVPHWHEVTAVRAPAGTKRFSVFGWWLTEERLYHLNLGGSTSY